MFEWYTAVLFWKSQSPWPTLRGGLYDWYLGMTGGYYGVRAALLSGTASASVTGDTNNVWGVHAQMNLMDHSVAVIIAPSKNEESAPSTGEEIPVRVKVDAYHLAGCQSGQLLYSRTLYVTVTPNAVFSIPNSTLPFVGNDVTLYRLSALDGRTQETAKRKSAVSEYWLSNWTAPVPLSSFRNDEIPAQDLSSLGEWRDDTSRYVVLDVSAMYCGYCDRNDGTCHSSTTCQAAGCTHSEIAVRLTNPPDYDAPIENKSSCGHKTIAFAIWTELHSSSSSNNNKKENADAKKDTRILPTLTSNGLFSILRNETRYVCMDPSLAQNENSEISKLQVHVSGWNVQEVIVPVQETMELEMKSQN